VLAEVGAFEHSAREMMGGVRNDDGVCPCETLKSTREVRRLAGDGGFLRRTLAEKIADNHGTGSNSDADREIDLLVVELSDRNHEVEPAWMARSASASWLWGNDHYPAPHDRRD
jgi:hypothetical protein